MISQRLGALLAALTFTALTPAPATAAHDHEAGDHPPILTHRERADVVDRILEERLTTLAPQIMREEGVSLWLLMAREYFEEPVIETMLDARSMAARRRTILIFFDPGDGQPVERLTVSRYGMGGLFEPSWDPDVEPDQWKAVADIIEARDPATIAINTSDLTAFGDGMTLSQYRAFTEALPDELEDRIVSGERLSIRWLETRTPLELEIYPGIVETAHSIMARAFSREVITPGETTLDDVTWWYREEVERLGLEVWFNPSMGLQRQGVEGFLRGDEVIQPGDLIWTDFGLSYLRLNTDTQQLGYILRPGETEAPAGFVQGLANTNRVQDILTSHFAVGRSGNEALALTRAQAIEEGLNPSVYTHPIGTHGHGAGPAIGFWDNQMADPRGAGPINANTAWAIELTSYSAVPEWDGQVVDFRSEKNAFFDGETVEYFDGRQTELILIPSGFLPVPGIYGVGDETTIYSRTQLNADGSYVDLNDEGPVGGGTWRTPLGLFCLDPDGPAEGGEEVCWYNGVPEADGSFTTTRADTGQSYRVTPLDNE